ncbi:unnamed protein product [Rhizophagus irregularis]|uniref:Peroxisomal membrane protein PEX14 n=1 Tax=Rhizophagus irregularis TaxID=588596 RepID=A0A916E7R7_9GLOM|nr:unnamed protein product [Rhizophagus irregularis]CAB5197906.1 unnamed protein product [Rhizophagus irregularis]CAB5367380.1 unnamed protein product [Rhizophagus irregularis]
MKESDDKFQDATLANNSPAAGEKENGRQAALDVGIATNNDTNITNSDKVDKVRELLGQRMTPEERERKKKELIEKQKEARQRAGRTEEVQLNGENTNVADTNATNAIQPTQPRENLILPAIKFLSSPQVRNANEDKKVKFLLSKGLTQAEIDIAKNRVDKEQSVTPPVVNPRMMGSETITQPPTDPTDPPPVPPRAFSAAMIAVIKKFLGPAVTAIIFAKQQLFSHQLNLFRMFNESLSTILSLRKSTSPSKPLERNNVNEDDESLTPYEIDEISTPPTLLAPLATDLSELTEKLSIHQQNLAKYDTMPDLQLSLTSLATYLSSSIYSFSSWSSSNDRDSSVSQVRSEIRSLKGLLINRRNFPKIPPVPSYSTQSQQSSSRSQQPQQQVDTLNEDVE